MAEEFLTSDQTGSDLAEQEQLRNQANQASQQQQHVPGGVTPPATGSTPVPDVLYQGNPELAPEMAPPGFEVGPSIEVPISPSGIGAGLFVAGDEIPPADAPSEIPLQTRVVAALDPFIIATGDEGVAPAPAVEEEVVVTRPTAAVLPNPPELPPPTNNDLRNPDPNDPRGGLVDGQTAEQGLTEGSNPGAPVSAYTSTTGTINIGDADGLDQITNVIINDISLSIGQIENLSDQPIQFLFDSETGEVALRSGDDPIGLQYDGLMTLQSYSPQNANEAVINVLFELIAPVQNDTPDVETITRDDSIYPVTVVVQTLEADGSVQFSDEAAGRFVALDDEPFLIGSDDAPDLALDQTTNVFAGDLDRLNTANLADNFDQIAASPLATTATTALSSYFDEIAFGADGEGSTSASLILSPDVEDGLINSGFDGIGANGEAVELYLFKDAATGVVYASNQEGGNRYLSFEVVGDDLVVSLSTENAIYHNDQTSPSLYDDTAFLILNGNR